MDFRWSITWCTNYSVSSLRNAANKIDYHCYTPWSLPCWERCSAHGRWARDAARHTRAQGVVPFRELQGTRSNSFFKPWLPRIRDCDLQFSIFLLMKSESRHVRQRKYEERWCHHILVSVSVDQLGTCLPHASYSHECILNFSSFHIVSQILIYRACCPLREEVALYIDMSYVCASVSVGGILTLVVLFFIIAVLTVFPHN